MRFRCFWNKDSIDEDLKGFEKFLIFQKYQFRGNNELIFSTLVFQLPRFELGHSNDKFSLSKIEN